MKSKTPDSHAERRARLPLPLAKGATLAGLLALTISTQAQYFDFDSGTHSGLLKSTLHPSTITLPPDSLGGHAYRLQGTPMTSGSDTNAWVFSFLATRMYTNFYAAVDIVAWNTNQDCEQVIGLLARANSNTLLDPGPFLPDAPNGLTFNARVHDYRSYAGPGNAGPLGAADQMSMWSIVNFGGATYLGNPVAVTQQRFRMIPGHAYRFVMSNTNAFGANPQYYTCSVYDVNDLTAPLLSMTGDDSYAGNSDYIPKAGYVGVFAYKLRNGDYDPNVDITVDNFYVGETAPVTAVPAPGIPHGKIGAPQVVNRVPLSFKNFHPAANGITFNATTLTTTNTINAGAIRLYLNGVDVSAGLIVSGPATNASVSYFGLATNVVYQGRIVVQDALSRQTINEWTFDTFTDAYLASSAVKVIEAEDYDFNDGSYINDPPASGFANYDPVNDTGMIVNSGTGYVDQVGGNAKLGGMDFFDYDSGVHTGENQYRHSDSVGTQRGNYVAYAYADLASTIAYSQSFENRRSKYSSLDPTLQEYIVERTEGGEWLNYTRVFDGTKKYNAYLRAAAGLGQPVRLDQIAAGPATNLLGRFNVPDTFYNHNYCYTPLVLADGSLAVINLSGVNTVRLTMDSPQNENTKQGLAMNYMVFVPAAPSAPKLYSSATVNGTYAEETATVVDTGNKRITVPRSGTTRFYRIGWTSVVTITGLSFSGSDVVLTYQ